MMMILSVSAPLSPGALWLKQEVQVQQKGVSK